MDRVARPTRSPLLASLLVVLMLALPQLLLAAHGPLDLSQLEQQRHQLLAPATELTADHTHDHGDGAERQADHHHGHNPADHLHETLHLAPMASLSVDTALTVPPRYRYACCLHQPQPPRRPPKSISPDKS